MDPKKFANLDPKLREAYERVMGTAVAVANPTVATTPPVNQPTPVPVTPIVNQTAPTTLVTPIMPSPTQNMTIPQPSASKAPVAPSIIAKPAAKSGTVVSATPGKSGILPVIMVIGGIVFFIIYTLLWVKLFKLNIPFLPTFF